MHRLFQTVCRHAHAIGLIMDILSRMIRRQLAGSSLPKAATVLAGLCVWGAAGAAVSYQTLDLSTAGGGGNTTISGLGCNILPPNAFPYSPPGGSTTLAGVPFVIYDVPNNTWNANTGSPASGRVTKVYPLPVNNVYGFYTLASLYWGLNSGTAYVTYVFTFDDGTSYQKQLANGVDLRDFLFPSGYANTINGTTTINAYSAPNACGSNWVLDRQYIAFPAPYGGKNLVSFTIHDDGAANLSRIFLLSATARVGAVAVGGTVSGLSPGDALILQNNGGDDLTLGVDGSFAFPTQINNGDDYAVTVFSHPAGKTCTITHGSGTATPDDVTNIAVACVANTITTTVSPAGGGTVTCTPNPADNDGASSCSYSANPGYTFAGWSGACSGTGTCDLSHIVSPQDVTATFTLNSYAINAAAAPPAGGTAGCTPNPVNHGSSASCAYSVNFGYTFVNWSGDCSGTGACDLIAVTSAKDVTANFAVSTYAITGTAAPLAGGSVSCTPNPVQHGGNASCTYAANPGYTFTGWGGDCIGSGACTLTGVTSPKVITANFTLNTYAITATVNPAGAGSASCTPNPVNHGDGSICTYTTNSGYVFAGWTGACSGANCVLSPVTGPLSVTANFVPTVTSGPIATRTSGVTATLSAEGCGTVGHAEFVDAPTNGKPAGTDFPFGLLDFELAACTDSVTVTVTYSRDLPNGTYYKESGGAYVVYPATRVAANAVRFTLRDNVDGEDDNSDPGVIHDPSGLGVAAAAAQAIPGPGPWLLAVLSGLVGLGAWHRRRRMN